MYAFGNTRPLFNRIRQRNGQNNKPKSNNNTIRDMWISAILIIISVMCFVLASKHKLSLFVGLVFVFLTILVWTVNLIKGHMAKSKDSIWHRLNLGCCDVPTSNDDVEIPVQSTSPEPESSTIISHSYTLSSTELKSILKTMLQELQVLHGEYNLIHTDDLALANDIIKDYSLMDYETDRLNRWIESEAVPSGEELNDVRHSLGVLQHNLTVLVSTVLTKNNGRLKTDVNSVSTEQMGRPRALSAHQLLLYSTKMHVPPTYEEISEQKKMTVESPGPHINNNYSLVNSGLAAPPYSIHINSGSTTPSEMNTGQIRNIDDIGTESSSDRNDSVQNVNDNSSSSVRPVGQYSDSLYIIVAPADETGAPPAYGDIHGIV